MKQTKIYTALRGLTSRELNRFETYLESPYFNSDSNVLAMFKALRRAATSKTHGVLDKHSLWDEVRPNTVFNDVRYRKYNSTLLKHLEHFLYQEYTHSDKGHEYPFILDALFQRRLDTLYGSVLQSGRIALDKNPLRDSQYYQRKYRIEKRFQEISNQESRDGLAATSTDIITLLDNFYILEKLRLYASILIKSFYVNEEYEFLFSDEIMNHVKRTLTSQPESIQIYYRLINTYDRNDDYDNYEILKELLQRNRNSFTTDEYESLYRGLLNYLARRVNASKEGALAEVIALYTSMLDQKVFNSQNELSPWSFKNAILAGLRVGKFDWVLKTLQEYSQYLPEDYRDNSLAYNYAQVHFYRKEFGKVLDYLQQVEYQDPTYALNSRGLLMAVYYETGEIDPLYSTINSFRIYLKRQKTLSDRLRTAYRELCKVTLKLAKALPSQKKKLDSIGQYLEENPGIASRQWLSTKLNELRESQRGW